MHSMTMNNKRGAEKRGQSGASCSVAFIGHLWNAGENLSETFPVKKGSQAQLPKKNSFSHNVGGGSLV